MNRARLINSADGSIVDAEAPTTRSASYQELLDLAKLPTLYSRSLQDIATYVDV